MGPVRIVTDSTADLPAALASDLGITVIPLQVHYGNEVYQDGVDVQPETFFEKLRQSMQAAYLEKEEEIKKQHKAEKEALVGEIGKRDQSIFGLMVKSKFATSPTIREKTIIPPDMAAEYFGKHFRVEGEGEEVHVVGYLEGEKILSKEKPGYIAPFEEALGVVIDAYPMKNQILRTSGGGAGAQGNAGGEGGGRDGKKSFNKEDFLKLPPAERLAQIHAGKVPAAGSK